MILAFIVVSVIALAELMLIFGLINRLLVKNGLPALHPTEAVKIDRESIYKMPPPIKQRVVSGSMKVGI